MTAAELNQYAAELKTATLQVQGTTEQARLRSLTPAADFDFMAPLPPMPPLPSNRCWEPAARHYQDLTEAEKAENAKDENQMSENAKTAVHFVTVTSSGDDTRPTVKFECRGDSDSTCHSYPDCECESWDDEHPSVSHDECWMQGWFDADGICYEGPDSYDMNDNCVPNGMNRSGEIAAHYECDGYVAWDFKEATL
jgi:hypothetical protein